MADPITPADGTPKPGESPAMPQNPPADPDPGSLLNGTDPAPPAADPKKDEPKPDAVPGPPEAYEFKIPDGMDLDKAALDRYAPILKELNLSQEAAQKLVDTRAKEVQEQAEAFLKQAVDQHKAWYSEVEKDPEFGGEKLVRNTQAVKRMLDLFDTDRTFRNELQAYGLDNHPAFFRLFARIAGQFSDDQLGPSASPGPGDKDPAYKVLWPKPMS